MSGQPVLVVREAETDEMLLNCFLTLIFCTHGHCLHSDQGRGALTLPMDRGHVCIGGTHSLKASIGLPLLPTVLPEFRVGFPPSTNLDNPSETRQRISLW